MNPLHRVMIVNVRVFNGVTLHTIFVFEG